MTLTATIAGAISMLANFAMFFGGGNRENNNPLGFIGVLIAMIVAPFAAMLVQMAISRTREYSADRRGAEICGNPLWLASALKKIAIAAGRIPNDAAEHNPATAHMFIINPLSGERMDNLFPPTRTRKIVSPRSRKWRAACRHARRNRFGLIIPCVNRAPFRRPAGAAVVPNRPRSLVLNDDTRRNRTHPKRHDSGSRRSACRDHRERFEEAGPARQASGGEDLAAVVDRKAPLDGMLDAENGNPAYRQLNDADRALVRAIINSALRHLPRIEAILDTLVGTPLPDGARALHHVLTVAAAQILYLDVPDHSAVDLAVEQAQIDPRNRRFASLTNAVLRRLSRERPRI